MGPTRQRWAEAYATQARSDWVIYKRLAGDADVAPCHSLHYLQMACEKIAKAYRWRDTSADEYSLTHQHVAFSKFMESFLVSPIFRKEYARRAGMLKNLIRLSRKLAREIEKLAPAVDRENSPENAEYPWLQDDQVGVPCEHAYRSLSLLSEPGGRTFLKLVARAFEEFEIVRI